LELPKDKLGKNKSGLTQRRNTALGELRKEKSVRRKDWKEKKVVKNRVLLDCHFNEPE